MKPKPDSECERGSASGVLVSSGSCLLPATPLGSGQFSLLLALVSGYEPSVFGPCSGRRCFPPAVEFVFLLETVEPSQHYPHQIHFSWPGPKRGSSCQAWK